MGFLRHFRGDPAIDEVMDGNERDALRRVIALLEDHGNDPAELEATLHANYEAYEHISHYNIDARMEFLENNQRIRQSQFVLPSPERLMIQIENAMSLAAIPTQIWANWRMFYTAYPAPRARIIYVGDAVSETVRLQLLNYQTENNATTAESAVILN